MKILIAMVSIVFLLITWSFDAVMSPEKNFPSEINLLNPNEFQLWELDRGGLLQHSYVDDYSLSPKAKEAIAASPSWLRKGLAVQFLTMDYYNIQLGYSSSFATGDLDGDGTDDLLISDGEGMLLFYKVSTIPGKSHLNLTSTFPMPLKTSSSVFITLLDLHDSGKSDLFLSVDGRIFLMKNISNSKHLKFEAPLEIYSEPGLSYSWKLHAFIWNNQACLVLGNRDGSLTVLFYDSGRWSKKTNEVFCREEIFASSFASPVVHKLPDESLMVIVSGWEGDYSIYRITGTPDKIESITLINRIQITYANAMAFIDINHDGLKDFVYLCPPDPVMFFPNNGNNDRDSWMIFSSQKDKGSLSKELDGVGYHRAGNILYATGNHAEEINQCANFILGLDPPYLDEVVYCISNFQTQNLLAYIQYGQLDVLVENVKSIYDMSERVNYLQICEKEDWTTLSYATSEGWKELPKTVYYHDLVMPNRTLIQPEMTHRMYSGHFYRTYLPDNETYGISLFSRVSDATTLYEAAYLVLYWLKVDIAGIWRTGDKPAGWYHIYKNLLNHEVGIWCAEWSIMYQAAARAMNIPAIIITAMGEDHQFNNFWADGWHHVDASSGEIMDLRVWKDYFGDPLVYFRQWDHRILSWPMITANDGKYDRVSRSPLKYFPPDQLKDLYVKVVDLEGKPVDGVQIILASHWPMEAKNQPIPNLTAVAYTDSRGKCRIKNVAPQNYTLHAISRIGSTSLSLPLKNELPLEPVSVLIPAVQPSLFQARDRSLPLMEHEAVRIEKRFDYITVNDKDYVKADSLAEFINAELSVSLKRGIVLLSKEFYYVEAYPGKKYARFSNGKRVDFDFFPVLYSDYQLYFSLEAMSRLFNIEIHQDDDFGSVILRYRQSTSLKIELDMKWFYQKHIPWIDFNFTRLNYFEYWQKRYGKLKFFITDEQNMTRLLEGRAPDLGEWYELNEDGKVIVEVPDYMEAPIKIMVYNPQLCTSIFYDLKVSVNNP